MSSSLLSNDDQTKVRVRSMARAVAEAYYNARAALGFPMCAEVQHG